MTLILITHTCFSDISNIVKAGHRKSSVTPLQQRVNTPPRQMELYASGFNAWGQLTFENPGPHDEPEDLHQFARVLTGNVIEHLRASLSHTTGRPQACESGHLPVVVRRRPAAPVS